MDASKTRMFWNAPQTPKLRIFFLHARTLCSGEYVNGRNSKEYIETRMAENLKYKGAL